MIEADKKKQQQAWIEDIQAVARNQDKEAFTRLFDDFLPLIRNFSLASQPGAITIANEIAQEVMIKVWLKAALYDPKKAAVNTWIFTLARNARIDYLRKNGRHISNIDPEFLYNDLADESSDPFKLASQKRDEEFIKATMSELPIDQKQALHMVYMQGLSHQEASEALKLPLGTLKSRIRLALKKLAVKGR